MKTMLHILFLNFLMVIMPTFGFSQCPQAHIMLNSQADVDAFTTNYPGCTDIILGLTISGNDITDLSPLLGITSINSRLLIENNAVLPNLEGLNNLLELNFSFDGLRIRNNDLLTDISALSNMVYDNQYASINISNNPLLMSLNGLQGNDAFLDSITIANNDSLLNLDGLGNNLFCYNYFIVADNDVLQSFGNIGFDYIDGIRIQDNALLNDISALDDCPNPIFNIQVLNNPYLSVCNVVPFCSRIDQIYQCCGGSSPYVNFENNATGCNNVPEVAFSCSLVPSNDDCNNALSLTIGESLEAYNEYATESLQVPACNDMNREDVWFTFNTGGFSSVDIIVSAQYNLQLWTGACESLSQVSGACDTDFLSDIPVTTNANYYLQVWSKDTPGLFDILIQAETLSIEDDISNQFTLYPNPTSNILNLESVRPITRVKVFDILGKEVLSSESNMTNEKVNISKLNSGLYVVFVEIDDRTTVHRIIKE
ncbi:T9SS type A sorting domain-containing protein [Psychroserpens luteus]|uniref:T9SS type A sorting domain-containing protein n=1 Tax=Psychroserpens luteus TaxID=1434066 RepID=A0ABW5ZTC5_9FLAO|nr:T9SS type A sorting domain-containing protein [Psychroserpens luteus]